MTSEYYLEHKENWPKYASGYEPCPVMKMLRSIGRFCPWIDFCSREDCGSYYECRVIPK
jgi:hypothetical protein